MTALSDLDAAALCRAYAKGEASPVEVTTDALARAERFDPAVNAFVLLDREGALAAARDSEKRWRAGEPLGCGDGVPATVKDNIALRGFPTRKGSLVSSDAPEEADAPAVGRLRAAGCVILGKTTMPEFGWKGLSDSPLTGLTRNPWNTGRTTGGSSAGAAACAALRVGRFHLGTDGAGSIRIPAAFTGVFGFKPSYGRVPAYPISVMGELAHLGPLSPSVTDAAAMLGIMAGRHRDDITSAGEDLHLGDLGPLAALRIAWSPRLGYARHVEPAIAAAVERAATAFAALGAHMEEADPGFEDPVDVLDTLWNAGAALALSSVGPAERARIDPGLVACAESGARIPASAYADALLFRRNALHRRMQAFHERFDLLLTPQMPTVAIPFGADVPPPGFAGFADWGAAWTGWSPFTYPFNITQAPAASVPCGLSGDGLPIALQLVGPLGADALVLRAARAFEAAHPFPRIDAPRAEEHRR